MNLKEAYDVLYISAIVILAVIMFFCLARAIKGPEITDRIVAVNMLGTLTIIVICILAIWMEQAYLLDVALIYAMISFLAVVVLTKVYLGVHKEHQQKKKKEEA